MRILASLILSLSLVACASRPATTLEVREYLNLKDACYQQLMEPGSIYDPVAAGTWRFMQSCDHMSWRQK